MMKCCKKRLPALLLALLLTMSLAFPALAAGSAEDTLPIPTVYLHGQGAQLYADKYDRTSEQIHTLTVPDGYIADAGKALIGPLMKGLLFNDWDEWVDTFVNSLTPLFEKQALDCNGEASDGSGILTSDGYVNHRRPDGTYLLEDYTMRYDWRLDPYVIADDLNVYIRQVKAATKEDKVNLIGRSIGVSVVMAYLEVYGMDDIENLILYCPSFYGMEALSKAFAGKVEIRPENVNNFLEYYAASGGMDSMLDRDTLQLLLDVVSVSVSLQSLDLPAKLLEKIYYKVYTQVYPRLVVKMYGSMPSYWSLVGDDDYEEAKQLVFGGQEETYARLIEKIDRFHYNNLNRSAEILSSLIEEGHRIHIVAKYGVPMAPYVENANVQSDMLTGVPSATLGAFCAPYGETLSDEYVTQQTAAHKNQYISSDLEIDASACLLPDHTWFLKNIPHRTMPDCVNVLFCRILNRSGYMTVFDDPAFPQYMDYSREKDEIAPLQTETAPEEPQRQSLLARIFNILRGFFRIIKARFSSAEEL